MKIILEPGVKDRSGDLVALGYLMGLLLEHSKKDDHSKLLTALWMRYFNEIYAAIYSSNSNNAFNLPFEQDYEKLLRSEKKERIV